MATHLEGVSFHPFEFPFILFLPLLTISNRTFQNALRSALKGDKLSLP